MRASRFISSAVKLVRGASGLCVALPTPETLAVPERGGQKCRAAGSIPSPGAHPSADIRSPLLRRELARRRRVAGARGGDRRARSPRSLPARKPPARVVTGWPLWAASRPPGPLDPWCAGTTFSNRRARSPGRAARVLRARRPSIRWRPSADPSLSKGPTVVPQLNMHVECLALRNTKSPGASR